jgi:uncharacterized membrane protein
LATLTVWKFNTPEGAQQALTTLQRLQREQLIEVLDGATVTWPADKKKPKTEQLHNLAGAGALGGAFWGMLFGLLFFIPILGLAIGAATGALMGSFSDIGIDDNLIKSVREKVTPGTSALFLYTQNAVQDKVQAEFKDQAANMELIQSNLTSEQEEKLKAAFGEE